ncbi:RHS domain-containing protein [Inquilinus limosus]|uniref:RHS repeat-associated core domain-containing protein n=1 Tax=Inquilinus limosus TaxID=171674 RepID=UPI003F16D581
MGRAARIGDKVAHSNKLAGFLLGAAIGVAAGFAIFATVATGGVAAFLFAAVLSAGAAFLFEEAGKAIGDMIMGPPTGAVTVGAPTVFVNSRMLGIAVQGAAACSKESSPATPIAQGSETVFACNWNAARKDDKIQCDAKIIEGSDNVFIGGPQATLMEIDDGIPAWAEWAVIAAGFIGPGFFKGFAKLFAKGGARALATGAAASLRGAARAVTGAVRGAGRGLKTMAGRIGRFLGDPVDMATGDYVDIRTDILIPGLLPIELTRAHRSGCDGEGSLGRRWFDSWGQHLRFDAEEQLVRWVRDDTSEFAFPWPGGWGDGENTLLPTLRLEMRGPEARIVDVVDGRWWSFPAPADGPAPITALGDRHGNRIDFDRADGGRLTAVRHSDGHRLAVDTDAAGRLAAVHLVAEPVGGAMPPLCLVRYAYDRRGHLARVDGLSAGTFRYRTDDAGRITRWADGGKTWTEIDYDAAGRVVETRSADGLHHDRFEYDDAARICRIVSASGAVTGFRHDAAGQIVERVDALGGTARQEWTEAGWLAAYVDELGRRTEYAHDRFGNVTRAAHPDGRIETFLYDAQGRPAAFVDPAGARWSLSYDEAGNLASAADPLGGAVQYSYDPQGRIRAVASSPGAGAAVAVTRPVYDAAGRVVAVTDPDGAVTLFERDRLGRVVAQTDPLGAVTRYVYDDRGNLAEAVLADGTRIAADHDGEGNVTAVTDGRGAVTRYGYGAFDLLREVIDPEGGVYRYEYDGDERLTAIVNPKGERALLAYDPAGRLAEETDFAGRHYRYRRDAAGRVTERIEPDGGVRRYAYDDGDRLVEETAGGRRRRFVYDERGLPVAASLDGQVTAWERDALGRVLSETQGDAVLRSAYQGAGARIALDSASGTTRFAYDPAGRLAAIGLGAEGSLSFAYDALGRETRRADPRGFALAQRWDALGRLRGQQAGAAGGRPLIERRWDWDRASNPVAIADSRWPTLHYAYDGNGQITHAAPGRPHGSRLVEAFIYDAARNLAGRERVEPDAAEALAAGASETAPGGGVQWRRGRGWTLLPGGAVAQAGRTRHVWDRRGRLVEKHREQPGFRPRVWRFVWDELDRLVAVETPDRGRWIYVYDALDRRIEKRREDGCGTRYVWDGDLVVEEQPIDREGRPDSDAAVTWTYAPGSPVPVARRQGGRVWYVVTDQVGAPRELVTADGRLAWAAAYDTWGAVNENAPVAPDAAADCPIRFPGQWHDDETGLHYNRYRVYDPETGQYLSPDPIGLKGGLRPHGYVPNPNVWVDPLGLRKCEIPSVRGGEFQRWFNQLSPDDFDEIWKDPGMRAAIQDRLRSPGGMHEWLMVSRANVFKRWGRTAEDIMGMRTPTSSTRFINPTGRHGGLGSTTAHNEILEIIDSSLDYDNFVRRLQNWADYRLPNGNVDLPPGLQRG